MGFLDARYIKRRASWPVWSDSTTTSIRFQPMPEEGRRPALAPGPHFDRTTRQPGRHGGAARAGLLNFATGRLDPSYAAIARKANLSESAAAAALKRLYDLGILTWVRRCAEGWTDGRYWRAQLTNAYAILPSTGWRGFCPPRDEPPAPHPDTWGKPPAMPSILAAAAMERRAAADSGAFGTRASTD